jgi:hypothetical protein
MIEDVYLRSYHAYITTIIVPALTVISGDSYAINMHSVFISTSIAKETP